MLGKDAIAKNVDIVLVDGGMNDINVEDVIDARVSQGAYIQRFEGQNTKNRRRGLTRSIADYSHRLPKSRSFSISASLQLLGTIETPKRSAIS